MFKKYNTITLNFLLIAGFVFYLFFVINNNLSIAIISLILSLYIWVLGNTYYNKFNIYHLIHISGYIGLLFSITCFFMYGVEEVPYPEGAIIFHAPEIAFSFLVCFISSVVILHEKARGTPEEEQPGADLTPPPFIQHPTEIIKEEWEEATLEDLESGNFEPAA